MSNIFLVSAASGGGKGTLCEMLKAKIKLHAAVSVTTREPREGEKEGGDYYFRTKEKFEAMIANDEFAEYAMVHGKYYGTLKSELLEPLQSGQDVLLEIDVQGCAQISKLAERDPAIRQALYKLFILTPSKEICWQRLVNRSRKDGTSLEDAKNRHAQYDAEVAERHNYDITIMNDHPVVAFYDFFQAITSRMLYQMRIGL